MITPSTNGLNGRRPDGTFAPGNGGGPGNPHAAHVAKIRSALLAGVTPDDVRLIVAKLVEQAKSGDLQASKLVLDRTLGKLPDAPEEPVGVMSPSQHAATMERLLADPATAGAVRILMAALHPDKVI